MKLILASISPRKSRAKSEPADALFQDFLARAARYTPAEAAVFETEAALLSATERKPNQPSSALILFDSTGENLTSEQFAEGIRHLRDTATQRLMLAIGPADGWSPAARARATLILASISPRKSRAKSEPADALFQDFLARAVMAEQVYRALTILAGHPYHSGH
jgi:23S rRNA (pseudouridine1915-N3)-methyltransferase